MKKWLAIAGIAVVIIGLAFVYIKLFHPGVIGTFGGGVNSQESVTYLVYGRDLTINAEEKAKVETDMILYVSLQRSKKSAELLFVPPNTAIEDGKELRDLYDERGVEGLKSGVEMLTGKVANHYVGVDYQAFIQFIDQLGGIEMNVAYPINLPKYGLSLAAGTQNLNGEQTLKLLRLKWGDTNSLGRIERQQDMLQAVYQKIRGINNLSQIRAISDAVLGLRERLETDVTSEQIIASFKFLNDGIDTFNVDTLPGELVDGHWIPTP